MIDSKRDKSPCAAQPLNQRKAKAQQQLPQPVRQPPIQETFRMREYIPVVLMDVSAKFKPKVRQSIEAGLVHVWDGGRCGGIGGGG